MMTNDLMLGGVYLLMAIMLVAGGLMIRREPAAKLLTMALAWVAIFGAGFVLFTFRDDLICRVESYVVPLTGPQLSQLADEGAGSAG